MSQASTGSHPEVAEVTGSSAGEARLSPWARYVPAVAGAAVMLALGLWGLARDSSMGNDEVATRWAALLNLHALARLLNHVDAVHGLYYLLMHVWVAVGTSPAVLRIPSLASMTLGAALIAIIARRLTGSGWPGLFAAVIMALTPTVDFYAQTARSYALVYASVLAATLVLLQAMGAEEAGRPGALRWWAGYTALMVLATYLNEMALLVLAAHAVTVLLARYGRRALGHWAAVAALSALLAIPLIVISAREDSAVSWIKRPGVQDVRILIHDYFGATAAVVVLLALCAAAALLPGARWWRDRTAGRRPAQTEAAEPAWWRQGGFSVPSVAAPLLVIPAALLLAESLVATPLYVDRYVLYGEAGAALLAGAGLYRIGRWVSERASLRILVWVPAAVVCVCALLVQLGPQQRIRTPRSRLYDFGSPSRYVAAHAHPGDGVLFFDLFFRKLRLGYPGDFRQTADFAMARSPQQTGDFTGTNKPFSQVAPLMLHYHRIWAIGRSPYGFLPPGSPREEGTLLRQHFTLIAEQHYRGVTVTLWLQRPG